ncbi:uncharacterized protein J4E79_002160 [Alternaria viburni]|uniref:uncharacterized protein n=1 Tax=Alternaria viburni TaxID=566460 RepID=UPI0020C55CE7|nr:uncharacterized protein J4E79_002160 [Alternaria viburni]KAI4667472.1 hypothetical protein J4E79_002160 [Alternaria viburni]
MDNGRYPPEGSSSREAKVAIPRIPGHGYQMPPATRTPRVRTEVVSKAVKIKCSGHRPQCINCQRQDNDCHYDLERKDRLKGAQRKSHALTALLIEVSSQLDDESKKRVEDTLASFEDDTPPPPPTPALSHGKRARRASSPSPNDDALSATSVDGGEAHVSASVGSNEDLDFVQEDILNTDEADNTGYMGHNSHVQWLRALETKIEQPEGEPANMPYGPPGVDGDAFNQRAEALHGRQQQSHTRPSPHHDKFSGYYFYLDKSSIDIDVGDPHVIPSAESAERLFDYYKAVVHSPFPILGDMFEAQLKTYFAKDQGSPTLVVCPKWKAVMNLVFAIGARYSHLIGAEWQADDRDHLVYMWRAIHLLQLQSIDTLVAQPDQALIQAAGLHLRHEDPSMSPKRKKALAQIWWSLYSIECVLTCITGRPRTVSAIDCTVPPPGAKGTELDSSSRETTTSAAIRQASESSAGESMIKTSVDPFDVAYVRIDILMDKILSGLYSAQKSAKSWKSAQKEIASLSDDLEAWALHSLVRGPATATAATSESNLSREQVLLYIYYHNAKICITRPCLCRLDLRIKGQSEQSTRFNQKSAEACIGAALDLTSMLPDPPNPAWFYGHACIDKLIRWLNSMKPVDAVSENAYNVIARVMNKQTKEEAARRRLPQPQITDQHQKQQDIEHMAFDSQQRYQPYSQPLTLQQSDVAWPSADPFNSNIYSQSNTGNFDLYDAPGGDILNDPTTGLTEYGQPLNLFYGNPYESTFDHWEWDPATFQDPDQQGYPGYEGYDPGGG